MKAPKMAPFAGLFLILTLCAFLCLVRPKGLPVKIAYPAKDCGSGVIHLIHVSTEAVKFNGEKLERGALDHRLREVVSKTATRLIFVKADAEIPFQKVARVTDAAKVHVDYVAVLTPSVEREATGCFNLRMPPSTDYVYVKPVLEMKEVPWWRWR